MTAGPSESATGETLCGRYELLDPIGRGGMSSVFRARDLSLNRIVAVKLIDHDAGTGPELSHLRDRFRREAANAAQIPTHPNVVQIYDYGTDPDTDRDFIVMELLEGRDLKTLLSTNRFSDEETAQIVRQAAGGLAAGHRAGIVHRDVKPSNLLLFQRDDGWAVRVLDFGISKALEGEADDELTLAMGIPHTPAYASPEQKRHGQPGPASDVYQLGLIAYLLLAGEHAFTTAERDRIAAGEAVDLKDRKSWSTIPESWKPVLERALEIDPGARFSNADELARAIPSVDGSTRVFADAEDETIPAPAAVAAAPSPAEAPPVEDATRVAPSPPPAPMPGEDTEPAPGRWEATPGPSGSKTNLLMVGGGIAAILLVVLLLFLPGGDPEAVPEPTASDEPATEITAQTSEIDEIFEPLMQDAAAWLEENPNSVGEP